MRLFTTSPCHVTKIGNKTANINAKTAKIKNGDKTFAAVDILSICCNSVYHHFLFLLFSMCNCAVNWCDKLCFCIY